MLHCQSWWTLQAGYRYIFVVMIFVREMTKLCIILCLTSSWYRWYYRSEGRVFKTQMEKQLFHVDEFTVLSKSIRPLPIVKEKDGVQFDAVTWPGNALRQRYVDLIVNPQVRDVFRKGHRSFIQCVNCLTQRAILKWKLPFCNLFRERRSKTFYYPSQYSRHASLSEDCKWALPEASDVGGFEGVYEFARISVTKGWIVLIIRIHCNGDIYKPIKIITGWWPSLKEIVKKSCPWPLW